MNSDVRETLCSKCLHSQVCVYKKDYLNMIKRLEELFYSVPEEDRSAMVFHDPDCKFVERKLSVPTFVNHRVKGNFSVSPSEVFKNGYQNMEVEK